MNISIENEVKSRLKKGLPTAGSWVQSCSNIAAEILAAAGFDWLLIDMEHSPLDYERLVTIIQAMKGHPAVPFVRAPWNDMVSIKRILDAGAYGIVIPYVNTAQEAKRAVASCKYPPQGVRGVATSVRAADFGASLDRIKRLNDEICVIIQLETPEAIRNLDAILEVEGLDGLFIGPMDLSTSMGYFCSPRAEEVQRAIRAIEDKVLGSGKFLGTVSSSWEEAQRLYERGYTFVTLMSDTTALGALARSNTSMFMDKFGGKNHGKA